MKRYLVTWQIDAEATTPRGAAIQSLETQRDPESTATVFQVQRVDDHGRPIGDEHHIDLNEDEDES